MSMLRRREQARDFASSPPLVASFRAPQDMKPSLRLPGALENPHQCRGASLWMTSGQADGFLGVVDDLRAIHVEGRAAGKKQEAGTRGVFQQLHFRYQPEDDIYPQP